MKSFALYFLKIFSIVIIIMVLLDFAYTTVYSKLPVVRTKYQWVRQLKNRHFDYVLLGSSRMIHHVNPKILNDRYGLNGINLAYMAASTNEILMTLESLLGNDNNIDTLFVQVDYSWNRQLPHNLVMSMFMPFIRENSIRDRFFSFGCKYKMYYYIPFYRYIVFEPKIGFRELMMNIVHKHADMSNDGFIPLYSNTFKGKEEYSYTLIDEQNENIRKIDELCKIHNIHVCYLTSPIYKGNTNNDLFSKYLEDYHDFSNCITEKELFQDATHLNYNGANKFTDIFGDYYFGNNGMDTIRPAL